MRVSVKKLMLLVCAVCALFLSGCSVDGGEETEDLSDAYAFVGKNIQNTYMQRMYEGFQTACSEMGVKSVYKAPEAITSAKQIEIINELTSGGVKGIAVAANDFDALSDALHDAMDKGINVISLDSAVNSHSRQTHIQQADPEKVGRELVRTAYELTGGDGAIAILTSTREATNQNLWIDYMKKEVEENPDKYASMPIADIAYGDDDLMRSVSETERILRNSDIKVIIAPTAVGIQGAAQVLAEKGSDVKLTGLGMPSQMSQYIESGVCGAMFLWNPVDVGYLAAYTLKALDDGTITGAAGDSITTPMLGARNVVPAIDGGTEVMLGDLLRFDASNINEWKDQF